MQAVMCIRWYSVFKKWNCRWLSKMVVSHFYLNVKLRHEVAPHVLKPVFLDWHSVITNSNIIFFQISCIESKNNGQNSGYLNMPFWHVCTELSMLSTNFLDGTRSIFYVESFCMISSSL